MKITYRFLAFLALASMALAASTIALPPLSGPDRTDAVAALRLQAINNQKYALILPERSDYFNGLALGQNAAADFIEKYPTAMPAIVTPPLPTPIAPPEVSKPAPTPPTVKPSPIPIFSPVYRRF